jgi:hypothetical protein
MKQAYLIKQGVEEFALAREQFAVIVDQLQSAAVLGMEHGEVERLVWPEGTEILRRLVQAHFNLRTGREKREAGVRGAITIAEACLASWAGPQASASRSLAARPVAGQGAVVD